MKKLSNIEYKEFEKLTRISEVKHIKDGKHYDISVFRDDEKGKIICCVAGQSKNDKMGSYMLIEENTISFDNLINTFHSYVG